MGAQCQGYCVPTNQYAFEIDTQLLKTDYKPLQANELVEATRLELGPGQPLQVDKRQSSLREHSLFEDKVSLASLMIIVKIQRSFRRGLARIRKERAEAERPKMKYFTEQDYKETLTGDRIESKVKEIRPKYQYKSGATYEGEWTGGFRHGQGTMVWPDGTSYTGNWGHGEPSSKGTFVYPNGDKYEGSWSSNLMNGFGRFTHVSGTVYTGQWKNGKQHGNGHETWSDGSEYIGQYSSGRKEGLGIFKWPDGSSYIGEWVAN